MQIKFLHAFNGDSIWISFIDNKGFPKNILIDGGTSNTYSCKDKKGKIKSGDLKNLIESLKSKNEKFDLVILTHIDDDHIAGLLKWFKMDATAYLYIGEIWFNSGSSIQKHLNDFKIEIEPLKFEESTTLTSVTEGKDFENYINRKGIWDGKIIKQGDKIIWNDISFQILTPNEEKLKKLLEKWEEKTPKPSLETSRKNDNKETIKVLIEEDRFKEDDSSYNGSSISFIMKYNDMNYLFLGDSHPSDIVTSLLKLGYNKDNKLPAEVIKISHHGSCKNTSNELLDLVSANDYVISTNGTNHNHPDKMTIARILTKNNNARILFNYPTLINEIILDEDCANFPNAKFLTTQF